jgi:hypothetical protein
MILIIPQSHDDDWILEDHGQGVFLRHPESSGLKWIKTGCDLFNPTFELHRFFTEQKAKPSIPHNRWTSQKIKNGRIVIIVVR